MDGPELVGRKQRRGSASKIQSLYRPFPKEKSTPQVDFTTKSPDKTGMCPMPGAHLGVESAISAERGTERDMKIYPGQDYLKIRSALPNLPSAL